MSVGGTASPQRTASQQSSASSFSARVIPAAPPSADIWTLYDGDRAFADVKTLVDLGPRPAGSQVLETARLYIIAQVEAAGWKVERQPFDDETPRGRIHFCNLIARFGGDSTTQQAIICSHYDTKLFDTIRFVGASDGGSSTGALHRARTHPRKRPRPRETHRTRIFRRRRGNRPVQRNRWTLWQPLLRQNPSRQQPLQPVQVRHPLGHDGPKKSRYHALPRLAAGTRPRHLDGRQRPSVTAGLFLFRPRIYDDHVPLQHIAEVPSIDLIDFNYPHGTPPPIPSINFPRTA